MSEFIEWGALGQVLVAGVLVGAGIPTLFALGLRLLAGSAQDREDAAKAAQARTTEDGRPVAVAIPRPGPARMAGAVLCLALVVAAVGTGLFVVVSGGH
ncbi:hypothetical protein [Promicromonospora sukumoe]